MTNPIASYSHGRCSSITGGAFVPNGAWSPQEDGDYLYADFVCGGIFRLRFADGKRTQTWFASGVGGPTALRFGPDNALYYADLFSGQVRRIDRTG